MFGLGNIGRGQYKEHFCEIILNLEKWFRRCCFKIILILSSGGHLVPWSGPM